MTRNNSLKMALAAVALLAGSFFPPLAESAKAQSQQIGPGSESVALEVNEGRLVRLSKSAQSVFIANAGIVHACDFLDLAEDDFDRVLRVNLKGVFLTGQAAARQASLPQSSRPCSNGSRNRCRSRFHFRSNDLRRWRRFRFDRSRAGRSRSSQPSLRIPPCRFGTFHREEPE